MQEIQSRGTQIDLEKCVENAGGNRFVLVILAAMRAKEILQQNKHSTRHEHIHAPVTSLLEVQNSKLGLDDITRLQ
jgi:DNA-directed RNA polymerase subunit K/omega